MALHLAFLITEDWYFRQHFLALATAAREIGYDVSVLCRIGERGPEAAEAIRSAGLALHAVDFQRSGLNPFKDLVTRQRISRLYRDLRPDIVHHVALKPIIHGQAAARQAGVAARINFLPGFGHVFTADTLKTKLLRPMVSRALARALKGEGMGLMVMNRDDQQQIAGLAEADPETVTVLPGTGVDLTRFAEAEEPSGPIIATYLGRFLHDKGLRELVEASSILQQRGTAVTIRLVGAPDPSNPASIDADTLSGWRRDGVVELHPWTDDVPGVWRQAHLAVLPSYREGFGMSLAEAAATGRALIASDVPGCRDVVRDGATGLLVPPRDATALADAIERLARDTDTRRRFAGMARRDAEQRFSLERINRTVLDLYETVSRVGGSP
ncbi:MAG: glycosyltransferase family 4 protein [Proteobacteria bacterium]|nr:glycosyltransferase family 4 protein [Pseudomonadota bacterium]MDA1308137.1 glycosyltransferase family 4 protein [Pseudomonadota bacterium]